MAPNVLKQVVHKPGPLKQSNKAHKGGKSRVKKNDKGKIDVKALSRKSKQLNRVERKNQLNQIRKSKRDAVLKQKRKIGGIQAAPVLVTILPLDNTVDSISFLENLKSCDEGLTVTESALGQCHISSSRLKQRFTFSTPNKSDLHSVMDSLKVSEIVVLLHSSNEFDDYTQILLSTVISHCLPTTVHVLQGLGSLNPKKKAEMKKQVLKSLESRFPDLKLHSADTRQEFQLLLRQIGSQKQRSVAFRDNRFHLLSEEIAFDQADENSGKGILKLSGYARGNGIDVNHLVHLPGWGTFQLKRIDHKLDPYDKDKKGKVTGVLAEITETPDPAKQESLQSEVIPDPMEGEQTWPTQEELDEADLKPKQVLKKVAAGTSEYQAAWIVESEDEDDDVDESEDEDDPDMCEEKDSDEESDDSEFNMDEMETISINPDENYDKNIDMDEEKETLVRFKEERMNLMFPDELDTPMDVPARTRFQRYRGLKNFKSSPWDPMENLPDDYARIYRFENFKQTKKKVFKEKDELLPGEYISLHISDVPKSLYDNMKAEKSALVIYGLLPHEQKMSVMNVVIRKHASCETTIKCKDSLIFHIGYSRFTCKPIFSEHKTGNKFKLERFLPSNQAVVATFYAPVMFPPATVVVYRQKQDGSHELVATGAVLDVNPNRVITKRIVLSGSPFKILNKTATVRYMFFNEEDINWFKSIELHTKCGRKGHIRAALGSHGHMKCIFDQQLSSQDVVLMSLYKRVFPKWNYDVYVPDPVRQSDKMETDLESIM